MRNKKVKNIIKFTNKQNKHEKKMSTKFQDIKEFNYEHTHKNPIPVIKKAPSECFTSCWRDCRKNKPKRACWIDCNQDCLH